MLPIINSNGLSLKAATEEFQKQQIIQILSQTGGNWSLAAKQLDVDRANLARLAKRLGIKVEKTVRSQSWLNQLVSSCWLNWRKAGA